MRTLCARWGGAGDERRRCAPGAAPSRPRHAFWSSALARWSCTGSPCPQSLPPASWLSTSLQQTDSPLAAWPAVVRLVAFRPVGFSAGGLLAAGFLAGIFLGSRFLAAGFSAPDFFGADFGPPSGMVTSVLRASRITGRERTTERHMATLRQPSGTMRPAGAAGTPGSDTHGGVFVGCRPPCWTPKRHTKRRLRDVHISQLGFLLCDKEPVVLQSYFDRAVEAELVCIVSRAVRYITR